MNAVCDLSRSLSRVMAVCFLFSMYGIICKLSIQFYDRGSYREGLKLTVKLNGISVVRLEFVSLYNICINLGVII